MAPYSLGLAFTPEIIKTLLAKIPAEKLRIPSGPDRFDIHDVVVHLADWEPILRGRIETALNSPGATIVGYDEGERAVSERYSERDLDAELVKFTTERATTVELLKSLTPEQWKQPFLHPERGVLTVQDQVTMFLGHDLYHLEQIVKFL